MKKMFGGVNLTWPKVIIMAIAAGLYAGLMAMLPITRDTSFRDIAISFEVWILFGIFIIMNSKSKLDSGLKCLVFFLISQPIIYLLQDVIEHTHLFQTYYKFWFIITLLCFPMGFIGHLMKKDKWYGLLILSPMLIMLGFHFHGFLSETISFFPHHLLSALLCVVTLIIYPLYIFDNKKIKIVGVVLSSIIIVVFTVLTLTAGKSTYNTTVLTNGGKLGAVFDDTYKAEFKDPSYGKLYIVYEKSIDDYMLNAEFSKIGETEFTLISPTGEKQEFKISVKRDTYHVEKK